MSYTHPDHDSGFVSQFDSLFASTRVGFESVQNPGRGPQPKLPAWNLLASLVYHVLRDAGHFSAHVYQLFGLEIKDSSLSERRQRMGLEPFSWLMKHALRPLAERRVHRSCFYKGFRLCGIDGSRWSVTNTPQIVERMSKATSRRMKAAFAKVEMCVLVELGLHNPVAAAVGLKGEGEWSLAKELLESLPSKSLLIVDRLYGCGKYLYELVKSCEAAQSELLVKARRTNKSHKARRLSDGSAIVSINVREQGGGHRVKGEIRVGEIQGCIRKPGSRKWSSFLKTRDKMSSLREVFEVSEGLLDEKTKREMVARVRALIVREAIPQRRHRSCPRKVRQPVGSWPRLTKNQSDEGKFTVEIVNFP